MMMDWIDTANRFLRAFVEFAFLSVLALVLLYLILGENSGIFVQSVADNVLKFAGGIPAQSLVGLAIVLALVFFITARMR